MRLTTDFWLAAWRRRIEGEGIPVYVLRRGDDTAGAVLVKVATLDGAARLMARRTDPATGRSLWMELDAGPEEAMDARSRREADFDPDLWIVEIADREGRAFLDDDESPACPRPPAADPPRGIRTKMKRAAARGKPCAAGAPCGKPRS